MDATALATVVGAFVGGVLTVLLQNFLRRPVVRQAIEEAQALQAPAELERVTDRKRLDALEADVKLLRQLRKQDVAEREAHDRLRHEDTPPRGTKGFRSE